MNSFWINITDAFEANVTSSFQCGSPKCAILKALLSGFVIAVNVVEIKYSNMCTSMSRLMYEMRFYPL